MKVKVMIGVMALMFAAPVFAFHCPADMRKIDAALAENPALSSEQLEEVRKLRAEGEALHNAGRHQESVDTLAGALRILGIDS